MRLGAKRLIAAAIVIITFALAPNSSAARTITVADLIRQAKIGDPAHIDWSDGSHFQPAAVVSPDASKAIVLVRGGDPDSRANVGSLYLIKAGELKEGALQLVASMSSATNNQPMALVKWLADGQSIFFAGTEGSAHPQIFRVSLSDSRVTRISDETDLRWYNVDGRGIRLVTQSERPRLRPDMDPDCLANGCIISAGTLFEAELGIHGGGSPPLASYDLASGTKVAIDIPEEHYKDLEKCPRPPIGPLSPDGRYALWICWVREKDIPTWWDDLKVAKSVAEGTGEKLNWYLAEVQNGVGRLMLVNLQTGSTAPLLDTPYSEPAGKTIWILNGSRVVLAGAAESLTGVQESERAKRARRWAILSVDPVTRNVDTIAPLDPSVRRVGEVTWNEQAKSLSVACVDVDEHTSVKTYVRRSGAWIALPGSANPSEPSWVTFEESTKIAVPKATLRDGTELIVQQSISDPPRLLAVQRGSGTRTLLLDPNQWLRDRTVGKVEVVTWHLRDGRAWRGGLIYPSEFVADRRYPLLIQTHGFERDVFDLDGGVGRNYPGQAFAAKGAFVLQVADQAVGEQDHDVGIAEWTAIEDAYESAIDYLDQRGLIVRARVGIIGWSRSGMYTAYTLTHSSYPFAAAAFTSTGGFGYWFYLAREPEVQRGFDADYGVSPFGTGLDVWRAMSPGFNLDRARTPTFMWEEEDPAGLWDWYSAMRRFQVPVEYWILPDGAHDLYSVGQRMNMTQLLVDWFAFWLKDEEEQDPSRTQQYERWREMRRQWQATDIDVGTMPGQIATGPNKR
jgi:hypothetical protein